MVVVVGGSCKGTYMTANTIIFFIFSGDSLDVICTNVLDVDVCHVVSE